MLANFESECIRHVKIKYINFIRMHTECDLTFRHHIKSESIKKKFRQLYQKSNKKSVKSFK